MRIQSREPSALPASRPFRAAPLIALVLALSAAPAAAETVAAESSSIVEVTVFRDRAEVVREVRIELPAGASTVEIEGIPFGVEADSLRVTAEGVPALLGAVELGQRAGKPVETAGFLAARDEVRRLEGALQALQAEVEVDGELRAFLASLRHAPAAASGALPAESLPDPAAVSGIYELLEVRLTEMATRKLERDERKRDLQEDLSVARARLETLRPRPSIRSRVAGVEVETARAGELTLRLSYVAPGASWRPAYRAALDAETGTVDLVAEGVVRQSTGEDWSGVSLRLSTASASQGVDPPFLGPWLLRPRAPRIAYDEMNETVVVGRNYMQNVTDLAPGVTGGVGAGRAEAMESTVVRSAYNVAFQVPGRSDVPADGSDHRVVLRSESLAGTIVYRTVPALAPRAYLTSVTTSPSGYPLLAGPVRVFAGGAYLGSFALEEKGPGVEFTVPFGVDNRLEIVRVPLPRSAGKAGFTGKSREVEVAYRTRIHNLQEREVTLILEDRVPVAEDERITVQLGKETTAGWEPSKRRPGVMLWTLELGPGEERELVLAYTVRHPRDMALPGLD